MTFTEILVNSSKIYVNKKLRSCAGDFNLNDNDDRKKIVLKPKYNICLNKVGLFTSLVQIHYLNALLLTKG